MRPAIQEIAEAEEKELKRIKEEKTKEKQEKNYKNAQKYDALFSKTKQKFKNAKESVDN